jgi:fumarylacetoacetase
MSVIDETHDPARHSWVASAQGHPEFPIQNLPFGVFSVDGGKPRGGVAIGDAILDLAAALGGGFFSGEGSQAAEAASKPALNDFLALGTQARTTLRRQVSALLSADGPHRSRAEAVADALLHDARKCTLHLPANIGAYTDFYAGIEHAANGGRRRGQTPPLAANYKYVPVAYHSRASSVRPSGTSIRRPNGQRLVGNETLPTFGPCLKLDFELELGIWIGAGNDWGEPIPIDRAGDHVAGFCLLNDWSARDIQRWEMAPLGPFLCKNFGTTVSPWVITPEALAPFRIAQPTRSADDPKPLDYLWDEADQSSGALDIELEVRLSTHAMRTRGLEPMRIALSSTRHLYWTVAQMVAHHTCGGCDLSPGDIFGSGTISAPDSSGFGSIAELSFDGTRPFELPTGEKRAFLEDGDEVALLGHAHRPGYVSIGFGDCRGRIVPAPQA